MLIGLDHGRALRPGEEDSVDVLLRAAFPTDAEARLVRALRNSGEMAGETVVMTGARVAAYYALSYLTAPKGWLSLAPVAVAPDLQRQRIGQRQMGLLSEWARITQSPVIVLGDPEFYEGCGFSRTAAANLQSPYGNDHLMAAGLAGGPSHKLVYPKAFDGL